MLLSSTAFLLSPLQRTQGSGEECQRGQCCDSHSHVTVDITLNTNEGCIALSNVKTTTTDKGSGCKVVGSLVQIFHLLLSFLVSEKVEDACCIAIVRIKRKSKPIWRTFKSIEHNCTHCSKPQVSPGYKTLDSPCLSLDSMDFSASTEALLPTSRRFARSFL